MGQFLSSYRSLSIPPKHQKTPGVLVFSEDIEKEISSMK